MRTLEIALLLLGLLVLVRATPPLDERVGRGDFRFNWTAAFLLWHQADMNDPAAVSAVQRPILGDSPEIPLITLSSLWAMQILLPYAPFSFERGAWLFLLTNIALRGVSALALSHQAAETGASRSRWWVGLLAAFAFSISLAALVTGQTTIFVLAMVTAILVCERRRMERWVGVAAAGVLVKPQMAFVTLAVLGLYVAQTRRWQFAAGFVRASGLGAVALWLLRRSWPGEYFQGLRHLNALGWERSNIGGFLPMQTGWLGRKYLGLLILPVPLLTWWRAGRHTDLRHMVDVSILASLLFAPYGFSYDQVVLLVPVITVLVWMIEGRLARLDSAAILLLLLAANLASLAQRIATVNEAYFFWVPLFVSVVYLYAWWRARRAPFLQPVTRQALPADSS